MLLKPQVALILSNIRSILVFLDKVLEIEKINKEEVIKASVEYYFFVLLDNNTNLEFVLSICNFVKKETSLVFERCLIDYKFDTSTLK